MIKNPTKREQIKVVIADDHRIFIEGLKSILSRIESHRCAVIGEVYRGTDVLKSLEESSVDLLLLDLNLPDMSGIQVLRKLKEEKKKVKVIVLTMYDEPKFAKEAFQLGADGYVSKNGVIDELSEAITEVMKGNIFMGKGVNISDVRTGSREKSTSEKQFEDKFIKENKLTKREVEVLTYIAQALSNEEIGKILYISGQTVGVHRKNLMRKLGVNSTAALIKLAYELNLT